MVELAVPDAPLWWPVGYGGQPLVTVTVDLLDPAGGRAALDSAVRRVGFRSVTLDESPDATGQRFTLGYGRMMLTAGISYLRRQKGPLLRELEGETSPVPRAAE